MEERYGTDNRQQVVNKTEAASHPMKARKLVQIRARISAAFRYDQKLLQGVVCSLLLLAIGWTLWQLVLTLRTASSNSGALPTVLAQQATAAESRSSGERLADLHLFGSAAPAQRLTTPPSNIAVAGIAYAAPDKGASQAILTINGTQQSYSTGSALPGGERISAILPSAVILQHEGGTSRLALEMKSADNHTASDRADPAKLPTATRLVATKTSPGTSSVGSGSPSTSARLQTSRQKMLHTPDAQPGKAAETAQRTHAARRDKVARPRDPPH